MGWLFFLVLGTTSPCAMWACVLPRTVVITGCTGHLGCEIAAQLADKLVKTDGKVIFTARDESRGRADVRRLASYNGRRNVFFEQLDVADEESISAFCKKCTREYGSPDLLINNAALCLRGADENTFVDAMAVNFWGPYHLMKGFHFLATPDTQAQKEAESHDDEDERQQRSSVVNVSSGDGELACLHSELALALQACVTPDDVTSVVAMQGGRTLLRDLIDAGSDLAYGDTPSYSVSKAALNCLTRTTAASAGSSSSSSSRKACSVNAVCPGDIVGSAMYSGVSSQADNDASGTEMTSLVMPPSEYDVSAARAAADVCWLGLHSYGHHPDASTTGKFFRFRREIPW